MKGDRKFYTYSGPVLEFDICICERWEGSTYAVSEKKARSNLTYQFKKEYGKTADSKIKLPGEVKILD